jgi:hypothetical protein
MIDFNMKKSFFTQMVDGFRSGSRNTGCKGPDYEMVHVAHDCPPRVILL